MSEEVDYEAVARKDGWAPKEEWRGDPDKWKSAEQFVKDGEQITAILKSKVEKLEARVQEVLNTNKKFAEFTKQAQEKATQEKDQLIEELKQARKQAITDGDGQAFDAADSKIQELQKSAPQEEEKLTPVAEKWLEKNSWYNNNETLGAYADGVSDRLIAQGFIPQSQAYFDELTERVKSAFPHEFENPRRTKANVVEDASESDTKTSKTFDDLPAEAKREFESFARDIPGFSKKDYLAAYEWE